jgi:hypothetical protein
LDEDAILLLLSAVNPPEEVFRNIGALLVEDSRRLDYGRLLRMAGSNEVSPLLYENLKAFAAVPDDVMKRLRNAYLRSLAMNARGARETVRILGLLSARGVEAMPLKGPLASEAFFGNPGLYPSADIDILVRPSDLKEVKTVLLKAGYKYEERTEGFMLETNYHLVFSNERHVVEVHWNLVKRYFGISPDFWWEETSTGRHGGMEFPLLSAERYVMYAVFRLFYHEFDRLKFFVFISGLIDRHREDMDWEKLLSLSERHGMGRLVLFTLNALNDLLKTRLPGVVLKRKPLGYGVVKRAVTAGMFRESRRGMRKLMYGLLFASPPHMLKVLLRRIFPGAVEISLRYRIPEDSKRMYVYYLLNPFLLPVLMLKRRER